MIYIMLSWANNPLALIAGFWLQLRCCKKGMTWQQKLLPVILYLAAMAGCLAEGFLFTTDQDGPMAALMLCLMLGVHLVVAESAWLVHWIIQAVKKRKEAKYQTAKANKTRLSDAHKIEENNL